MPKATMKLTVLVTLDVPAEYAAKVTREDLINMARSAVPDSLMEDVEIEFEDEGFTKAEGESD